MYCEQCGNRLAEGSLFCEKCGAKVAPANRFQQTNGLPENRPAVMPGPAISPQPKKNSMLRNILAVLACIMIAGSVLNLVDNNRSIDYVEFIKAARFSAAPQGSSITYEDAVDSYFESPNWKVRKGDNGVAYVDISGTIKGSDQYAVLTICIEPTDDPEVFWYTPIRLMLDGDGASNDQMEWYLTWMYYAAL